MTRPYLIFRHYIQSRSLLLFVGDVLLLTASFYADEALWMLGTPVPWPDALLSLPTVVVYVLLGILSFFLAGLYESNPLQSQKEIAGKAIAAGSVWGILYLALGLSAAGPGGTRWGGLPPGGTRDGGGHPAALCIQTSNLSGLGWTTSPLPRS